MANNEEAFLKELVAAFQEEAAEHLAEIVNGLLKLEKEGTGAGQQETLEIIYRAAHSMKGAARAVNFSDIETLCQAFETVLAEVKKGKIVPRVTDFDTLQQTVDLLQRLLLAPGEVDSQATVAMQKKLASLLDQDKGTVPTQEPHPAPAPDSSKVLASTSAKKSNAVSSANDEPEPSPAIIQEDPPGFPAGKGNKAGSETVRIATKKLSFLFRQVEEMMAIKLYTRQRLDDIRKIVADQENLETEITKITTVIKQHQASSAKTDKGQGNSQNEILTGQILEFADWSSAHYKTMYSKMDSLLKTVKNDERFFGRMVDEHLEDMKKVLMLPFSHLLAVFPKMARDLARDQDKEINFTMTGSEVEIDRRILEGLKDPLIHLVRNCIDHGIEKPGKRQQVGKPPQASLTITVCQCKGNKVEIEVTDDGGGIDRQKVVDAALKVGFIKETDVPALTEQEALACIFQSGVTTSPLITDISGRGLGLAIVREKVDKIGGTISLTTNEGVGTSFTLQLPAMMSTFRGVFIRASDHVFAVPSIHVQQVLRLGMDTVKTVENRETVSLGGNAVSLVWLSDILGLPSDKGMDKNSRIQLLDLCVGTTRIAFVVDEIIREGEGLVKRLGKQLVRVRNFSGVTVMGTGDLVPIIDVPDLMMSASQVAGQPMARRSGEEELQAAEKSLLVVEDSVTSRMLLKNVLESAGYRVVTAVDGLAGWTELKAERFSAVVSDIEMPRMNGFELTAKIRGDQALRDMPVILVTSLDAREDRERGIEAGANAYIVKSSFDQNNLLEVIMRLL